MAGIEKLGSTTVSRAISVWTDGAGEPNPGVGGWDYMIRMGDDVAAAGRAGVILLGEVTA